MKHVYVGLSGGVDSSVTATLLKEQGFAVTGVFIKTWQPDFIACNWERERIDAMRVAAQLEIPFRTFDAEDVYKREVGEYMIREYAAGRTPNPDVMCNTAVKFGAFLQWALAEGADAVATGHYARVRARSDGTHELVRGVDTQKDQSYFLWNIGEAELKHILFPVGDLEKSEVRAIAERAGLPVATKKDSQGVCFLGPIDMESFLGHFVEHTDGAVLDEMGQVIGTHTGALRYTVGQRHGFTVHVGSTHEAPYYVIAKDIEHNTITVSHEPPRAAVGDVITLEHVRMRHAVPPDTELLAQFRYRQTPVPVSIGIIEDGRVTLSLQAQADTPAPGQSCVLYQGDVCVGGGIVT